MKTPRYFMEMQLFLFRWWESERVYVRPIQTNQPIFKVVDILNSIQFTLFSLKLLSTTVYSIVLISLHADIL